MSKHLQRISKYRPSALQGTLRLEVARPRARLSQEQAWEPHTRSILSIALIVLTAAYLYFVAASIMNVIARTEAMREMQTIQSAIAGMEQRYFALRDSVTPQEASSLGLSQVKNAQYVYVPGNAASAGTVAADAI